MDIPAASRARQQLVVCDAGTRQKSGKFQSWPCCLLTLLQFISFNYPNPKKKNTQKNQEKKQLKNSDSSPQKLSDLTRLLASKISDRKIPRLFSSLHLLLPKRRERERERERERWVVHMIVKTLASACLLLEIRWQKGRRADAHIVCPPF